MLEILEKGLLRVEPGLLLWTIITFVVLLVILWKAAWKPVVEALDARDRKGAQ
jgi:F-type H+-transporting ATPase subunit b